jgi:hypothetical protein
MLLYVFIFYFCCCPFAFQVYIVFLGVEGSSWNGALIVLLAAEPGSILLGRASIVKGVRALFIEDGVELKYVERLDG